ncbi:hypothetical protein KM043_009741 [Ampulex compressa]|nr:hypothetical protein KM043_009741 [Ampulex compressa]
MWIPAIVDVQSAKVIRFAGGLRPVILTFVDVSVGLPSALVAVRTIRKSKASRCCPHTKEMLSFLLCTVSLCAVVNIGTLISIGYDINVKPKALADLFNSSMHLYIAAASYKYAIDEIQFIFQCCGSTGYTDWFPLDWQKVDYAPREEMDTESVISDEEYRYRGVPFSCCKLRSLLPCAHVEISAQDVKTINTNGCVEIISTALLRIVIVAYVMTSTLVVTQILLAFLLTKIMSMYSTAMCIPRFHTKLNDQSSSMLSNVTSPETECCKLSATPSDRKLCSAKGTKKLTKRHQRKMKRISPTKCISSNNKNSLKDGFCPSIPQHDSQLEKSMVQPLLIHGVARIMPSIHEEHRISKKRLYAKCTH